MLSSLTHFLGIIEVDPKACLAAAKVLSFLKQKVLMLELWLVLKRMAVLSIIRPVPSHRGVHMLRPLE